MTPDELVLVQRSFEQAFLQADALAVALYDHLWSIAPDTRAMFPEDMAGQRQKLLDELSAIVVAVGNLDQLVARTAPLGSRHVEYGVEPHHYELVGEALFAALADVLGDDWNAATAAAWEHAYDLVAETMLRGASTASHPGSRHPWAAAPDQV
jgi:hemoglobin-like flavoprotein